MSDSGQGLVFLPLGGCGEIGMNLSLYGCDGEWLMVDLGVSFGDDASPGVELFMADPRFIEERRDRLRGLVLTHAHEDHLGAVAYLWPRLRCPVYATAFTAALLRDKLVEAGLLGEVPIAEVAPGQRIALGGFEVELVRMTHSLPEPNALAIRTRYGTVVHSGDWKLDAEPLIGATADEERLRAIGDQGVLALTCDSTNILVAEPIPSERLVRDRFHEIFPGYRGRIAVACFATNVARLESVALAAAASGREVAAIGRSLRRIERIARATGYLGGVAPFLDEKGAARLPPERLVALVTGSQGEPRAALTRIAQNAYPNFSLDEGDVVVFSSRIIPGNEIAIGRLHNALLRKGVEVVTERDHFVHVSGHPGQCEVRRLYALLRPAAVVPIHGELMHLRHHAAFAKSCGVAAVEVVENGDMLRLAPGAPAVVDHVLNGRLVLDGGRLRPFASRALRERRRLARDGALVVTLVMGGGSRLAALPQVSALGLLDEGDGDDRAAVAEAVRAAVDNLPPVVREDDEAVREAARLSARRWVERRIGRKPPTEVHLVRL